MENFHRLAAIRGTQAHRSFYVAMLPYGLLKRLLGAASTDTSNFGRPINKARLPLIAGYVASLSDGHCVPPIHVMVDGLMRFESADSFRSVGYLSIDGSVTFRIIDGRHRIAAIAQVIAERPNLSRETLPVCFYASCEKDAAQAMFEALNGRAVRPAGLGARSSSTPPGSKEN